MVRRWARDELRTKQARFDFAQSKIDSEDIVKAYEFRKKYPQLYDKLKGDKTSKKLKFKDFNKFLIFILYSPIIFFTNIPFY
jgi:hypothetical protein